MIDELITELGTIARCAKEQLALLQVRDKYRPLRTIRTKVEVRCDEANKLLKRHKVRLGMHAAVDALLVTLGELKKQAITIRAEQQAFFEAHLAKQRELIRLVQGCVTYDESLIAPWLDEGRVSSDVNRDLDRAVKYLEIHAKGIRKKLNALRGASFEYQQLMGHHIHEMESTLQSCLDYRYFKMLDWAKGFEEYEVVRKYFRKAFAVFYTYGAAIAREKQKRDELHRRYAQQTEQERGARYQKAYSDATLETIIANLRRYGMSEAEIAQIRSSWGTRKARDPHYSDLPNDALGLRRLIQANHPDKGAAADVDLFQRAKNKLDAIRP